jgi:basic membrane protein A
LALISLLASIDCSKRKDEHGTSSVVLKAGLVFDVGGRGDKSFNDAAYKGLELAKTKLGVDYEYVEPGEGADRESALRILAKKQDVWLVFGIGFIFTDDITAIAKEFPSKKFACIDYSYNPSREIPSNLIALEFREEEGSFLVGALAALCTKTNTIGFVGGMDSPLIRKFEAGYVAGAKYANSNVKVLIGYAGVTGEAFKNPGKGKELALGQYAQGADIIFHASGVTGLGVFEAAREKGKLSIGVDMDQYHEAPGNILTSMIKVVDVAVYETVLAAKEGRFEGGKVQTFGLKSGGLNYVYDENNRSLIPDVVHQKVEEIRKKIVDGNIKVPTSGEQH